MRKGKLLAICAIAGLIAAAEAKVYLRPTQPPPPGTYVMMVPAAANGQCDSLGMQRGGWTRYCAYQRINGPAKDCKWLHYGQVKRAAFRYSDPNDTPEPYSWREGGTPARAPEGAPASSLLDCRELPKLAPLPAPSGPLTGKTIELGVQVRVDTARLPPLFGSIDVDSYPPTRLDVRTIENSDFDVHPWDPNQLGNLEQVKKVWGGIDKRSIKGYSKDGLITIYADYVITRIEFQNGMVWPRRIVTKVQSAPFSR